jgi:hypothetical protein
MQHKPCWPIWRALDFWHVPVRKTGSHFCGDMPEAPGHNAAHAVLADLARRNGAAAQQTV